jgi:hypothetical protein
MWLSFSREQARKELQRMAKRRGNNEGCIAKRPDGRWHAYITLEGDKRKYFYGKTRSEVAQRLKEAQRQLLITTPLPKPSNRSESRSCG